MFLILLLCQVALAAANPFHKYPYVFLLDVGNEELEKTNTEQIRLTIPGGSLALRYPAIGNGDPIAHVRVSGIDFGTDLKASILDGGPGYKYVVLVFMGNPGVPYDAVMTIQTVSECDIDDSNQIKGNDVSNTNSNDQEDANDSAEVTDDTNNVKTDLVSTSDANDSSEDTSDGIEPHNGNGEVSQESSNVYNYAKNELDDGEDEDSDGDNDNAGDNDNDGNNDNDGGNDNDGANCDDGDNDNDSSNDGLSDQNEVHRHYSASKQAMEVKDYQKYSDMSYEYNDDQNAPEQSKDNVINIEESDEKPARAIDNSIYQSYSMIRPGFFDGIRFYPQNAAPFILSQNAGSAYDQDDTVEFDQNLHDEENNSQRGKYRDLNNNNFNSEEKFAVVS